MKQTTIQLNQDIIFQSDSVYYHFVEDVGISKKVLSIEYDSRYTWHFKDKLVADAPLARDKCHFKRLTSSGS